jgi:isopentenyl-diphosphate delta-isomerase type 1
MTSHKTSNKREEVVLLDDLGKPSGTMDKSLVHTSNTPLHSAFSVFLFDNTGRMLTQQRALTKQTWPGIWSNACCGHPAPGESHADAAQRRLREELGITGLELTMALPNFRYRSIHEGVMENEVCPVLIGFCQSDQEITVNKLEVEAVKWVSWNAFFKACDDPKNTPFEAFSPWSLMEGRLLKATPWLRQLLRKTA